MNAGEPGAWDEGMGADREEAHYEDLCEYARAVLDNPEHKHRDDFGGYARETISGLLKWIERLESRLSVSCQRNMSWRAKLKEKLAAAESRAASLSRELLDVTAEWETHCAGIESRAERLENALAPFIVPESYSTAEEACRRNAAMDWCAVHSFRWPCPVTAALAALAEVPGE